jgi:hypothetical protein
MRDSFNLAFGIGGAGFTWTVGCSWCVELDDLDEEQGKHGRDEGTDDVRQLVAGSG